MKDEKGYAVVLSHATGSSWDGTRRCWYIAVECIHRYRHVEPRYVSLEEAEREAARLTDLGYEV